MNEILAWVLGFAIVQLVGWLLSRDKVKDIIGIVNEVAETVVAETEQLSKFNEMTSEQKKEYQMSRAKIILEKLGKSNAISDEMLSSAIEQAVLAMNLFRPKEKN